MCIRDRVWINISQNHATNDLEISIKDNGIGREKSAALKKGKSQLHQSHGTATVSYTHLDVYKRQILRVDTYLTTIANFRLHYLMRIKQALGFILLVY